MTTTAEVLTEVRVVKQEVCDLKETNKDDHADISKKLTTMNGIVRGSDTRSRINRYLLIFFIALATGVNTFDLVIKLLSQ